MPGEDRIRLPRQKPQYSREQKAALGIVISFGSLALVFGCFYLWKHIASPFTITYSGPRFLTGDEKDAEEARKAKQSDTDSDGVNDYDELHIYKTSPYLSDSDSDGKNDLAEITTGGDPNCATGSACDDVQPEQNEIEDSFLGDVADEYGDTPDPGTSEDIQTIETLANLSTDQIRQLLIEAGADPAAVQALSDEELEAYFAAALQGTETPTETTSEATTEGETIETEENPQ